MRRIDPMGLIVTALPRYGQRMTDSVCPYCKDRTQKTYVPGTAKLVNAREHRVEAAFTCFVCGRYLVGGAVHLGWEQDFRDEWVQRGFVHESSSAEDLAKLLIGHVEYWEPVEPVGKTYRDVPSEIASAADEAYRCHSIGAHRAAVLMARGVIEAVAKGAGIDTGKLYSKIEAMEEARLIRPIIRESAHEVRHLGNEVAHGDFETSVISKDDAADVLEIMDDVIDEVLVVAARAERRKARRTTTE